MYRMISRYPGLTLREIAATVHKSDAPIYFDPDGNIVLVTAHVA